MSDCKMVMTHVAQAGHMLYMYKSFYCACSAGLCTEMTGMYHLLYLCGTENQIQDLA